MRSRPHYSRCAFLSLSFSLGIKPIGQESTNPTYHSRPPFRRFHPKYLASGSVPGTLATMDGGLIAAREPRIVIAWENDLMNRSFDENESPTWQDRVRQVAGAVRRRVLDHTLRHNGGYLSQACSSAEVLATLYLRVMNLGPSQGPLIPRPFPGVPGPDNPASFTGASYNGPQTPELDRFVFSPVHYALVLYSVLIEVGRLAENALQQFNQDGSSGEVPGSSGGSWGGGVGGTPYVVIRALPSSALVSGGVARGRVAGLSSI